MEKKRVGLALSGGAAKGLAHIGVLEILQKEGIPIDIIAGTSAGALVGSVFAQGKDMETIKKEALSLSGVRKIASLADLTWFKSGLIKGKRIKDFLRRLIGGDVQFADTKIPFAVVATDINTGEEVVIKEGSVIEAVRASIAIPGIFTVVKWNGRYLVDGSLVNPMPVNVVRDMGADFVIAVNVIPDFAERASRVTHGGTKSPREPNIFSVMVQSIYIGTYTVLNSRLESADVTIKPHLVHIGPFDFHRIQECVRQGELAAQDAIPEIKRRLESAGIELKQTSEIQ